MAKRERKTERLAVRLTKTRKEHLAQLADQAGVSMTEYVTRLLKGVWDNRADELRKRVLLEAVTEIIEIEECLMKAVDEAEGGMCMAEIDEARSRVWDLKEMLLDAREA